MKLCRDCKHHHDMGAMFFNVSRCLLRTAMVTDYVNGGIYPDPHSNVVSCQEQRGDTDKCGPHAKWFEPKEGA